HRSAPRSRSRGKRGERAEGEVAFRREERAALAVAPRETRGRAADLVATRELVPAAAGHAGKGDAVEPVKEAVARAGGAAVPTLGRRDRRPAAVTAGHVNRLGCCIAVQPDAPHVRALVHLEHRDASRLPDREVRGELVVRRLLAGERELVVEIVPGELGEAAEADLEPLVGSVRALAGTADADPAGDVAGEYVEAGERSDGGADPERVRRRGDARIAVAALPAGECQRCAEERACRDDRSDGEAAACVSEEGLHRGSRPLVAARLSSADAPRIGVPRTSDPGLRQGANRPGIRGG